MQEVLKLILRLLDLKSKVRIEEKKSFCGGGRGRKTSSKYDSSYGNFYKYFGVGICSKTAFGEAFWTLAFT